jgi:predicted RNA binding protein YcfA (HicA-like mRNA interferase family)
MKARHRTPALVFGIAALGLVIAAGAQAQMSSGSGVTGQMHSDHDMVEGGHDAMAHAQPTGTTRIPTMPGQEAFGTIQEIVRILENDPSVDWTKVDIAALREHLVDMNSLVIDADVEEEAIPGGLRMMVTGQGKTLRAIHAMVPAHAPMIDGMNGWGVTAESLPDGAVLTATAADAREASHIQGLGFYGLMATGAHHQIHHLNIARGEPMQSP